MSNKLCELILELLLDPATVLRLDTIAKNTHTSRLEVVKGLIWTAYFRPHREWEQIVRNYRDRSES